MNFGKFGYALIIFGSVAILLRLALSPSPRQLMSPCLETVKMVETERRIMHFKLVGCDAWGVVLSNLTGKPFLTPEQCSIVEQAIKDRSIIPPEIFDTDLQKMPEQLILNLIQPFSVRMDHPIMIDVGTNVGHLAIQALQKYPNLQAVMMEPEPQTCLKLFEGLVRAGVADRTVLSCSPAASSYQLLTKSQSAVSTSVRIDVLSNPVNSKNSSKVVGVPVDSLISPMLTIAVFKTDTQGFECNVMQGSVHTLRNHRPGMLLVEVSYSLLKKGGCSVSRLMNDIYDLGYVCTVLAFHGLVAVRNGGPIYGTTAGPAWDRKPRSIAGLEQDLSHVSPVKRKAGWTDVLCVPF
jgi:FkbM family methyltransferase